MFDLVLFYVMCTFNTNSNNLIEWKKGDTFVSPNIRIHQNEWTHRIRQILLSYKIHSRKNDNS